MPIEIRRAQAADLHALVPLFDAYRSFFTGKEQMPDSPAFLAERLRLGDSVILLAFKDDRIAGFLQLYPLFSSWHAQRIWFLSDLYVVEALRKGGIGKALVVAAQTFARENGSRSIMVEIPYREPHLVAFYESLRFRRDKDFNLYRYYQSDEKEPPS